MTKRRIFSLGLLLTVATTCLSASECDDYKSTLKVEARVSARWNALLEKKHDLAYTFFAQSYKDMVSEKDYQKNTSPKLEWKAFDITRTRCKKDSCEVHVASTYRMQPQFGVPQGVEGTDTIVEKWLRKDGEWWFVPPLKE